MLNLRNLWMSLAPFDRFLIVYGQHNLAIIKTLYYLTEVMHDKSRTR